MSYLQVSLYLFFKLQEIKTEDIIIKLGDKTLDQKLEKNSSGDDSDEEYDEEYNKEHNEETDEEIDNKNVKGNNEENGRRTDEEADNETEEEDEDDTGEVFSQILPSLKIAADRPAILVLRPTSSSTTKANLDECVSGKAVSRTILALKNRG